MDRRALIVGSWLPHGREPSHQKVRGILDRWKRILSQDGDYTFGSLNNPHISPEPLVNPKFGELMTLISDEAQGLTSATELLVYFVGHSVSHGKDDIQLILRADEDGEHKRISLDFLLRTLREATPIRKFMLILDSCHCGCAKGAMSNMRDEVFVMFAAGSEYAFEANFSDCLLKSLEQPIRRNDQRLDRRNGGITYRKLFEDARGRLLRLGAGHNQYPECFGDEGDAILRRLPVTIPKGYNEFAPRRSVYGRINHILAELKKSKINAADIDRELRMRPLFLTRKSKKSGESDKHLSEVRMQEYLDLLRKIEWVVFNKGDYQITKIGMKASDDLFFNELLLISLEKKVFGEGITFKFIDEIISDLLRDMIPPTPVRIQERAAMKGAFMRLDKHVRIAIQLLPMAGRFLKGSSDAIYPAEFRPQRP